MTRLLCFLALASGCVTPLSSLTRTTALKTASASFELKSEPLATMDEGRVHGALERVAPKLDRWGGLATKVTVKIAPSHDHLERAVGRPGYDWLRAWAMYGELIIQSPATWAANDADLDELVVHELTHCLLFQRSGTEDTWAAKEIPLWFREGMAVFTADQGLRFPSLEDLAGWLEQNPAVNVFGEAEELSKTAYAQIYGLSYHAMRFFLRRHQERAVTETMALMREGDDFEGAFTRAVGLTPRRFQTDFLNFVRFRAFRGFGLKAKQLRESSAPNTPMEAPR